LNYRRLRTTTSYPSCERAIGSDEGLGSRVGSGRSLTRYHRGKGEGLPLSAQLTGLLKERIPHTRPIPFLRRHALGAQAFPDLFRRDGNVNVAHPEVPQGIDYGIRDSRWGSHRG
jgi:hypothetical protein